MRALVIEFLHEVVKSRMLQQDIHARRAGSFLLERQMHAFMAAVLLRVSRFYALEANAKAQPPDGELTQFEQRMDGREGDAVIGADKYPSRCASCNG